MKSLLIMFHKQDRNSNNALVFVKKQLWLSRLPQKLTNSKKKKSFDLGFRKFTKLFVPCPFANGSNRSNLMLAKKVWRKNPKVRKRVKVKTMDWVYQHQWKAHQKNQKRKEKSFCARNQSKKETSAWENIVSPF